MGHAQRLQNNEEGQTALKDRERERIFL